jgi:ATP-dependent Zn protease
MATNRADTLDPALLRPGRLDRKIEFPNPDRRQKRMVLQVQLVVSTSTHCDSPNNLLFSRFITFFLKILSLSLFRSPLLS